MSYRLELALVVFVGAALGVAVWAAHRGPKAPSLDLRASTLLAGPDGSKALYDVLVRLGRRVARRRTPLFGFAEQSARGPALLVVLDPPIDLEAAELEQLVTFVKGGGAVLAAGRGGGVTRCAGWRLEPEGFADDSVWVRPRPPRPGLRLPRAARVLAARQPGERLEGLRKRRLVEADDRCDTLVPHARDTVLAAPNGQPVVLRLRYGGGGSITLAADVGWFRNRVWRDTDVPYVVLPLLAGDRRRVVWDEYHHGFGTQGLSVAGLILGWLRESPAGWAALQLVAVGLLWLAVTAVRFGPAQSVIERRRRSPLEHLEALAAGLESAAGVDTAVQLMVAGLRRRLSRTGTRTADSGQLSAWLGSLELALPSVRGRQSVRALQRAISHPGGPERVLAAAHAVEDVWEELRPRTTRDAS
ncbi:MAG TPA: DUF4350 domain-containing protein [Gemmatimonadales bacterium]|jgi:hypothetical protein